MKIYYLNTYDSAGRFNLSGERAKIIFNELQKRMESLGYEVERVNCISTEGYYDTDEYYAQANYAADNVIDSTWKDCLCN